jgi:hypothetical protein
MQPQLSPEDSLRLNVLLAGSVEAIRIDEGALTLHALTGRGEARVTLHPNCRPDQYLLRVREMLGGHALGSPGGYPVYLRRWTRMGQTSGANLAALLLLGEPEAVVAVAHAPGLTDDLARRVWWTLPTMEIARCMLARDEVALGPMGRVLADFLVEHMPFEESADANLETIRLVLGAGLADAATRAMLWSKGQRQPHYYIGFLEQMADDLPQDAPARDDDAPAALQALAAEGNPFAVLLSRCLSASGQTFLKAAAEALAKPATHRIVYDLFDVIGAYFESVRPRHAAANDVDAMTAAAESRGGLDKVQRGHADALLAALPQFAPQLRAMLFLSQLSQDAADQVLTRTTAVGPLMRRKLEPVIAPIAAHIQVLRGADHA